MVVRRSDSQRSRVTRTAHALSGDVVARGVVLALARLLAVIAVGGALADLLAAPAAVPGRTDASSADGVTQRPVLTLTPTAAMWTPVTAVARYTKTHKHKKLQVLPHMIITVTSDHTYSSYQLHHTGQC